jgi:hypothetical protein
LNTGSTATFTGNISLSGALQVTAASTISQPSGSIAATSLFATSSGGSIDQTGGHLVIAGTSSFTTSQANVTIALTNIVASGGGSGGSGAIRVGFLAGDVNQNRVVTVADLGLSMEVTEPSSPRR